MTFWVVGAGAVGLSLGARLARAGESVRLVTRRPEAARALADGVRVEDPATAESFRVAIPAQCGVAGSGAEVDVVLLCVRALDTEAAAEALATEAPRATVVSVQNDVTNEPLLARHFERVVGGVYRQTCTRVSDAEVRALGAGRIVVGAHTESAAAGVEPLAAALRAAGYDVGVSPRIGEDKWLKLCVNLMSAPNALVRRDDHETEAFVETKARCLEEARAVLAAEGIVARSCDGRDRSLDEEIAWQRESLARGASARRLPIYNQVWQSLHDDRPLEADRYHRRILALGERHGIATPTNRRVLAVLLEAAAQRRGPESVAAADLLA